MEASFFLGLACLCSSLTAMVLDFNTIRGSAELSSSRKGVQCSTDKDCQAGKFCRKPWEEVPSCAACLGLRRRCQRSAMCCPGTLCINDVCSPIEKITLVEEKKGSSQQRPLQAGGGLWKGKAQARSDGAQEGEGCLRTSDCRPGLCCARHFWAKICKPVLMEGQVCSRRGQKDGAQGPEIFQRCDCGPGLSCQMPPSETSQRSRLRVCQQNMHTRTASLARGF